MEKHRSLSLAELNQILPRLQATIELLTGDVPGRPQGKTVASRVWPARPAEREGCARDRGPQERNLDIGKRIAIV